MIYILALFIITWVAIALYFGNKEAELFHGNNKKSANFKRKWGVDIHVWFNTMRAVPAGVMCIIMWIFANAFSALWLGFSFILMFPFLHDGMYYMTRNELSNGDIYKERWRDQSTTTSAKISLPYGGRLACLMLSLVFIILIIIKNY